MENFVALVNLRSGGKQAAEFVLQRFTDELGKDKVCILFNTSDAEEELRKLETFLRKQSPRAVIVAGGDGTISYVMSVVQQLHSNRMLLPSKGTIAPFPLGTGNDLSYTLGFGSGFSRWILFGDFHFRRFLLDYTHARTVDVDRWSLEVFCRTPNGKEICETSKVLNNYFSVGFDAEMVIAINRFRQQHPFLFITRFIVKLWYLFFSAVSFCTERRLGDTVRLSIDGMEVPIPPEAKSVAVCNVLTYAGGSVPWDSKTADNFAKPSVSDGLLEIVCFNGVVHLALIRMGFCSATKLGQGREVDITSFRNPCQFDGEGVDGIWDQPHHFRFHISYLSSSTCLATKVRREVSGIILSLFLLFVLLVSWYFY